MVEMCYVQTIGNVLQSILESKAFITSMKVLSEEEQKDGCKALFLFATMWAFGGPQSEDKFTNYKNRFDKNFRSVLKTNKFSMPEAGICFDY